MIILISGASHTGKTALAQRLMEQYYIPYLSIDHLKMGLIRSGYTQLTPEEDGKLTDYLWPVLREMIKTAIENEQNMILEGCYVPFDWQKDFHAEYLAHIKSVWLVMTERYIRAHFDDIRRFANVVEKRMADVDFTMEKVLEENRWVEEQCRQYGIRPLLIDKEYRLDISWKEMQEEE